MSIFFRIAEHRIREAMERGELDNLPCAGRPLEYEDETWIPEDVRMIYRILKNSGFVPPELELHNEVVSLRRLMDTLDDDTERIRKLRELNFKIMKLEESTGRTFRWDRFPGYENRFYEKALPE